MSECKVAYLPMDVPPPGIISASHRERSSTWRTRTITIGLDMRTFCNITWCSAKAPCIATTPSCIQGGNLACTLRRRSPKMPMVSGSSSAMLVASRPTSDTRALRDGKVEESFHDGQTTHIDIICPIGWPSISTFDLSCLHLSLHFFLQRLSESDTETRV